MNVSPTFQGLSYPQTQVQFQPLQQMVPMQIYNTPATYNTFDYVTNPMPCNYVLDYATGLYVPISYAPANYAPTTFPTYQQQIPQQIPMQFPPMTPPTPVSFPLPMTGIAANPGQFDCSGLASSSCSPIPSPLLSGMTGESVSSRSSECQIETAFRPLVSRSVPSQKTSLSDFQSMYSQGLLSALENVFSPEDRSILQEGYPAIHLKEKRKKKKSSSEIEISWYVNTSSSDFARLRKRIDSNDFENSLSCELAKISNFNKYLDGAKQLTIIDMGYKACQLLQHKLTNPNGELCELLNTPPEERFEENCRTMLYRVCDDAKGNALRGKHVVGIRFKQQEHILKMDQFLQTILENVHVERATMIASLKKNQQYKGWSLYLDVENDAGTEAVMNICTEYGFTLRPKQCFIAED